MTRDLAVYRGNGALSDSVVSALHDLDVQFVEVKMAEIFPIPSRGESPFDFAALEAIVAARGIRNVVLIQGLSILQVLWARIRWKRSSAEILNEVAEQLFRDTDEKLVSSIRYLQTLEGYLRRLGVQAVPITSIVPALFSPDATPVDSSHELFMEQREIAIRQIHEKSYNEPGHSAVERAPPQAVVLDGTAVVDYERTDTNRLIDSCRSREGSLTLVKLPSPHFNLALDQPTIGDTTIVRCARAGVKTVIVDTAATRVVNKAKMYDVARTAGVRIVSI